MKGVLIFYHCQNKLWQIQWFKTTPIYYLTISIDQKLCKLGWISTQSLTRLKSRCCRGCIHFWKIKRLIHFLDHSERWKNSVPCSYKLEVPLPCWLSAEDHSQFLDTTQLFDLWPISVFKTSNGGQVLFLSHIWYSLWLFCLHLPLLRTHVITLGPPG